MQATLALTQRPQRPQVSNMSREAFLGAVDQVKEHIMAGDVFQLVLSQRFQRTTFADPFEIYRCSIWTVKSMGSTRCYRSDCINGALAAVAVSFEAEAGSSMGSIPIGGSDLAADIRAAKLLLTLC